MTAHLWLVVLFGCAAPNATPETPGQDISTPSTTPPTNAPTCGELTDLISITDDAGVEALAIDAMPNGEIVVGGLFWGEVHLGDDPGATMTVSSGWNDAFIARFERSGALVWSSHPTGSDRDQVTHLAHGADGSLYVLGERDADLTVEGVALPDHVDTTGDIFLLHYDSYGFLDWTQNFSGTGIQSPEGLAVADEKAFVVGNYRWPGVILAPDTPGEMAFANDLPPAFGGDLAFLAQVSAAGELEWATSVDSGMFARAVGVSPLEGGGVAWGGQFSEGLVLAPGTPQEVSYDPDQPEYAQHPWVAAYNGDGAMLWSENPWGEANDFARQLFAGVYGPVLIGWAGANAVFGGGQSGETQLDGWAEYAASWRADGSLEFAIELPINSGIKRRSGAQREDGSVLIASMLGGGSIGTGDFEIDVLAAEFLSPAVTLWSVEGQPICLWQSVATGEMADVGDIAMDDDGGVWLAATFDDTITLGPGTSWERTLVSEGGTDAFVARFQLP